MSSDVDFSINDEADYDELKIVFERLGTLLKEQQKIDSYKIKESITVGRSGGVDFYKDGKKLSGIDVGLHELDYGTTTYIFNLIEFEGFSIERMLADKLIAILSRKRFRRTKDLYDFYILTNSFDVSLSKLSKYVEIRGGAEWDNIPFREEVIVQYKIAWEKLELTSIIADRQLYKPSFKDVLNRLYTIAIPLKNNKVNFVWKWFSGDLVNDRIPLG